MKNISFFSGLLITLLVISSACSNDDDPIIPNEEELITTLKLSLIPQGGGTTIIFEYRDLDGDGGNAPTITAPALTANTTYVAAISLLNEQSVPAEEITVEIEAEAEEHQFFYSVGGNLDMNLVYNDNDGNGFPIGLSTIVNTIEPSQGNLTILLRHEPDKAATGVASGDPANAGGETDIEVTFNVTIE